MVEKDFSARLFKQEQLKYGKTTRQPHINLVCRV